MDLDGDLLQRLLRILLIEGLFLLFVFAYLVDDFLKEDGGLMNDDFMVWFSIYLAIHLYIVRAIRQPQSWALRSSLIIAAIFLLLSLASLASLETIINETDGLELYVTVVFASLGPVFGIAGVRYSIQLNRSVH
ncbi:MAG: hypothetical protein IH840_10175 [Candidatus Heimdallarchaeota archaeon]|nr:hypothetical protein [Candidatus Heimdallarchaeota archaeon]